MSTTHDLQLDRRHLFMAGALYLAIIVCGVAGDGVVRGMILSDDPAQTTANIASSQLAFRLSMLADVVMVLADVALGALLFWLLAPVDRIASLLAMAFRLAQAAVLGANLTHLERAASLAIDAPGLSAAARDALVTSHVQAHAAGYDLGLFFFGLNCLIVASLLRRGRLTPLAIHLGLALSGVVYLTGSVLVVLGPALPPGIASAFSVAYVVPLVAEVAFCGWLLVRAGRRDAAVAST